MALYDDELAAVKKYHPEWDEETQKRWAESRSKAGVANDVPITDPEEIYKRKREDGQLSSWSDQEKKGIGGAIDYAAKVATELGEEVSKGYGALISDETANSNGFLGFVDKALETAGDIAGGTVRAVGSLPKFGFDAVGMLGGSSQWGYGDTKKRAEELEGMGVDSANAWITAIEEGAQKDNITGSNDNLFAQSIDHLINDPIFGRGLGAIFKGLSKGTRAIGKAGKVSKVVEDAAKTTGAVANVADDAAKAGKAGLKQSVKNFFKDTKVGQTLGRVASGSIPAVTPIIDIAKPIYKGIKTRRGEGLRAGIAETIASGIDTVANFVGNPYSYRLPRIWSYDQSQKIFGDTSEAYMTASDKQKFYDEHGYAIDNALSFGTDDQLTKWYDQQGIAENKRLSIDELKQTRGEMGDSFINNYLSGARDIFTITEPWHYNEAYYEGVKSSITGTLETVETTPRGRIRTSGGLSIDISDGTITDSEGNTIRTEDLTEDQMNDVLDATLKFKSGDYSGLEIDQGTNTTDTSGFNITGLDQNTEMGRLAEGYVQNGMLSQATVDKIMQGNKSADAVYIIKNLNETSKEFTRHIVDLYTADEINNSPELQNKIEEQLGAYQRWFTQIANEINSVDESTYGKKKGGVYWYRDAMVSALNKMSINDQNLINSNIYRQAIDYNNSLEEGIDETWMKAATSIVRATDDWVVNKLFRDDNADIVDALGLSGLGNTAVNPNVVGAATMFNDVKSALTANAAYLIDTAVVNFINNNLIEGYLGSVVNKGANGLLSSNIISKIGGTKLIANKGYNRFKGGVSEAFSEPLENLLDAITMVDSADTNYDWMPGLLIGALQGGFAGYASSRSNYTTINDYFSDPRNRTDILNRMGIDISKISDPQKRAQALALTNQMFDNVVGVMAKAYAESNYGVENLAQSLAVTLINNDMAAYATDVLDVANLVINTQQEVANQTNNGEWTDKQIMDIFGTREMFDKYNRGENFSFNPAFINTLRTGGQIDFNGVSSENIANVNNRIAQLQTNFNNMRERANGLIVASQQIKGNSLQEVFDKMTNRVDLSGQPIRPQLTKEQRSAVQELYNQLPADASASDRFIYEQIVAGANVELKTIGEYLGLVGEGSEAWDSNKGDYKKTIKIKTEDGKEQRISIRDYILQRINEAPITQEQKAFIANMLLRTTVLGINSYFKDDGSLTRMGKDFFNSVLPAIEQGPQFKRSWESWRNFMERSHVKKVTNVQKSKQKAMSERGAESHKTVQYMMVGGQKVKSGEKLEADDRQIGSLTINGQPYTLKMLERDGSKTYKKDGLVKTISFINGVFNIEVTPESIYNQQQSSQNDDNATQQQSTNGQLYGMSQGIVYSDDPDLQSQYEAYMNQWFFNSTIPHSLEREYVWDNPSNEYNDMRIRELKSKIEKKLNKTSFGSGEGRWMASWLQELNVRLAQQQQQAQQQQAQQQQQTQQQKVEDPDNIKTYGSKYVLDNMSGQSQIKDKYGHKVKSVKLSFSETNDIDKSQLTLPPEGVDFMDYQINGGIHFIVDKQGNVYTVFDSGSFGSEHFFETGIVKKGDEGIDNDIIDYLESINDRSLTEEGWILKVNYDYYVEHKKAILNGTEKPNWKKIHKSFVDFIESRHQSSDNNDDTTPPPAAPAAPSVSAIDETIEGDVEVSSVVEDKTEEEIKRDNGDTRSSGVLLPLDNRLELVETSNNLKKKLPIMARNKANVNIRLDGTDGSGLTLAEQRLLLGKEPWKYSLDELNSALNSNEAKQSYQVITITYKENGQEYTKSFYAVPQINYATNPEDLGEDREKTNRALYFNSFVLVSTDPEDGEYIDASLSTIFRGPEESLSNPNNNYIYQVVRSDGQPVTENRIINFTQHVDRKTGALYWRMATTIQLNRLSYEDRQRAYKNGKVFLVNTLQDKIGTTDIKFERDAIINTEDGEVTVKYDYRPIYTTSDMVMNPNITNIDIGNANIDVSGKQYVRKDIKSQTEYKGIAPESTSEDLQEMNEMLVIDDSTRSSTKEERQAIKDLKKLDEQSQEANEQAIDDAIDLTDDPNVSEEESINEHNKSIDPNIYAKERNRLQLIASESEGFPLGDFIDLETLSGLKRSKSLVYWGNLQNCIKDKDAFNKMSDIELYNFINKISILQDRFMSLISQGNFDDGYENIAGVLQDLQGLIENDFVSEAMDRVVTSGGHRISDAKGMTVEQLSANVLNNGYAPIEMGISIDDDGNIINVNYGTADYTRSSKNAAGFIHSHPNGSFFSREDLKFFRLQKYKKAGLVLPGGVILKFDVDDRFNELMYDENGEVNNVYQSKGISSDDIIIAIKFALDHGSFDQQQWGEFSNIANEMKDAYEKNMLDKNSLTSFSLLATTVVKKIAKSLDMQLSKEAVASGDTIKYYLLNTGKLKKEAEGYDNMNSVEAAILDSMPDILDETTKFNKEILDGNNSVDNQIKSQILKDMKELNLSLDLLDAETLSDIFMAYNSGKGINDVILYLARKTRVGQIDNYLKDQLIKNGVLNKDGEYDGQNLDLAISLQGAKSFATKKAFGNNLSDSQMVELKNEFVNTNIQGHTKEEVEQFADYYMDAQIFRMKAGDDFGEYKNKAITKFKIAFKNFDVQQGDITEENVYKATFVSNWMSDDTKGKVVDAIAKDIIINSFHMNYNNVSEKFKDNVKSLVKQQLDSNKIVSLGNPYSDASLKGTELVPVVEAMPDDARTSMAKEMKDAGIIGGTVYNYLMKIDPLANVLDQGGDLTNGIISSIVIKAMDKALGTDRGTFVPPRDKLQVFLDIYRYYSLGGNTYDGLINILKNKYKGKSIGLTRLVNLLEEDATNSKNGIYSDTVINEISKPTELIYVDDNPYLVFTRSLNNSDPNNENIIVESLLKQYNLNPDSFFSIVKFAPLGIKSKITDYMRSENDKEHGNNKALGMVMSFLGSVRNRELLNNIAQERAAQKHTDANLDEEVNKAVVKVLTDWNDDALIMNPSITSLLYRETGMPQLDLSKGTVLYVGSKAGDFKPSQWETLDGKQTFPLKMVRDIKEVKAGVNIIVPEGKEFQLPAGSANIHKIVRARVGIKNGLMVRSPRTSYHNDDSMVGNIITGLGKMGYDISIREGFEFTKEQKDKLNQKKRTKNLYWNIFKEIVAPSLPGGRITLSRNEFNKLLTKESMADSDYLLLQTVIASKSPDDKINAAIILINQVTNGQLALKTDLFGTTKSIDIISASEKFEKEFISLLDKNSITYERDKTLLWNFFNAYVCTLMQIADPDTQFNNNTGTGLTSKGFAYLISNHQAAMGLMKQLLDDSGYATSKYAYLPGENVLRRENENFFDTMNSLFKPDSKLTQDPNIVKAEREGRVIRRHQPRTIKETIKEIDRRLEEAHNGRVITSEVIDDLKASIKEKEDKVKLQIEEINNSNIKESNKKTRIDALNKSLNNEIKSLKKRIKDYSKNKRVDILEYNQEVVDGLYKIRSILQKKIEGGESSISYVDYSEFQDSDTERRILEDIERMEDEENPYEVMDIDSNDGFDAVENKKVESENFEDKDAVVFATIFNNSISDNLYDVRSNELGYREGEDHKFVSDNLLSSITVDDTSAITSESSIDIDNSEVQSDDMKFSDAYKTAISIGDMLSLQTMISSNKADEEEIDRILNFLFQLPDGVSENDPVTILFNKTKEKIIRDPDSFSSEISKLVDNDLVNFDIYAGDMVTTHKPNREKIKGLAKKLAETVIKFNIPPLSESELAEARKKIEPYFQDNTGKSITPADDQVKLANEIVTLYDDRNGEEKKIVYAPGFAGAGKSTSIVASLKAIKEKSGAWSDDIDRIKHGMKVISDNFFNDSKNGYQANKLYSYKRNQGPLYMKVSLDNSGKSCYIKFKGENIKTHDELVREYTNNGVFNEDAFVEDYTNKTNGAWTREGLLTLFEVGEGYNRDSKDPNGSKYSKTRYMIEDFEYQKEPERKEGQSDDDYEKELNERKKGIESNSGFIDITIHGLGNNITTKKAPDGTYQGTTSEDKGGKRTIDGTGIIQGVYIFTKNHATIQAIKDLMEGENGLYGIQTATMDSNLVTYSSSSIPGIGYGAYPVVRTDKKLSNCLILIDETQGVDTATLDAIIEGFKDDNNIMMLGDPSQRSQNTIFKEETQKDDNNIVRLNTIFRGPQDMQDTNKLNNLGQEVIAESGYVMVLPNDSENYQPYTDVTELFDLEGTTMYVAGTNDRVSEINRQYFEWATNTVNEDENIKNHITTSTGSYAQRTRENAQNSDVTIAFAFDFNTAGEKATKNAATPHGKYLGVQLTNLSYDSLNKRMSSIGNFYKDKGPIIINIAGNGIYTLKKHSSEDQEYYNRLLKEAIGMMIKSGANIKKIISGGQTGIDEAGIKAAQELGLDWEVHTTSDYKFRGADGKDIADKEKFINRFISTNKNIGNNKPIPTMVIDAVTINKKGQQVTDKGLINKRYHNGIDLSEYTKFNHKGEEMYFKVEGYDKNKTPIDVKVYVPLMPNTDSKNVRGIKNAIQEKYPHAKIEISTTAFALTTAKESGKTVNNLIMDQDITNPEYDIYTLSNTQEAYDAFTRGDKKVYYPANASNVLFMSMQEIHDLVNDGDPNITLTAPVAEITTTRKTIRFPRFYANDQARDATNILGSIIELDTKGAIDGERYDSMMKSLNNASNTERLHNSDLLLLDISQGKKKYGDKYAEGNGQMVEGLKTSIALKWNDVRNSIRKNIGSDIKSINKFNKIDGWVYGKQTKTPSVEQGAMFASFQLAHDKLTYESFLKGKTLLSNGDRGMFLVPTKTIDSKGNEVRSLIPAKVEWTTKNRPGVLTNNNEDHKKQKFVEEHDKRLSQYMKLFEEYKGGRTDAMKDISTMLAVDIATHTQDEDFLKKVDIQKPSGQLIKGQVGQEILSPNGEIALINGELANGKYTNEYYTQEKIYDVFNIQEGNLGEAIRNRLPIRKFYATSSDYEYTINLLGEMKNSIINRMTSGEWDDGLKNDIIDFVDAIYNIDMGLMTSGEYESLNSGDTHGSAINYSAAMDESDEQTTCKL